MYFICFQLFWFEQRKQWKSWHIRRPKCFCFVIILNLISAALLHMWECEGSVCKIFHILCGLYIEVQLRWCVWLSLIHCSNFFFMSVECFGCMKIVLLICCLNHWTDFSVGVPLEWYRSEFLFSPFFQSSIDFKRDIRS